MVLANLLLAPEIQAEAQDVRGMGSVTVLDLAKLSAEDRARFLLFDHYQPKEEIDLAFCNGVFHHIPPEQRARAIAYVYRCLRPGGLFALWENNPWNPGTRLVMSRIPFDRDALPLSAPGKS